LTDPAVKQAPIAGISIPIATLALVVIAIAPQAFGYNALALLHDGFALVSSLTNCSSFHLPELTVGVKARSERDKATSWHKTTTINDL
jgi:hypothetical protein